MFNPYECIKHKSPIDYFAGLDELAYVIQHRESPLLIEIRSIDRIKYKQEYYDHKISWHPCISVHGIFENYLSKNNFKKSTGYLYYDYDDFKGDIGLFKEEFIKAYGNIICLLTISTGGKGLGFFVKLNSPELITADNFIAIHKQVKEKYFPKLKIDIDKHAGGITRQWIIPHDKNIYYNENASLVSFDIKEINIGAMRPINKDNINNNMGHIAPFAQLTSTKPIRDIYDTIVWKTPVQVEHPVVDIKPIDFYEVVIPRHIPDTKKHSTFMGIANGIMFLNPDIALNDLLTVMSWINTKFTGKQPMLSKRLIEIVNFVYNSDGHQVETHIQYVHFNKKCGLSGNEKRFLARRITAKLTIIQSMVKIDKAITAMGLFNVTAESICYHLENTGDINDKRSLRTIKTYLKVVKEKGVIKIADELIIALMAESEFLKEQRLIKFEGIDLPLQTPTVKKTNITHMTNNNNKKPLIEQEKRIIDKLKGMQELPYYIYHYGEEMGTEMYENQFSHTPYLFTSEEEVRAQEEEMAAYKKLLIYKLRAV